MSDLNALRRKALEELKETVLSPFRRKEAGPLPADVADGKKRLPPLSRPVLNVLISSPLQLEETLSVPEVSGVYLPADYVPPKELAEAVQKVHAAGKEAYYALPFVFRQEARELFENAETLRQLREAGPDGVLLRSLDELAFWQENSLPGRRIADAGLYSWNREAEAFLKGLGANVLTLPLELHEKDYGEALFLPREQVVYGRLPLMVSAQCVKRTKDGCLKAAGRPALSEPQFTVLTDRTGAEMPCESRCRFCMGVIYNAVPLFLGDAARDDAAWRLQLTDEDREETRRILSLFAEALRRGEKPARPEALAFTRGNYRKGVQ